MSALQQLNFDNSYAKLAAPLMQFTEATPLKDPFVIHINAEVARLLDINPCQLSSEDIAHYFSGAAVLPGAQPLAMKYTGHQFGSYNPELGDGRGLLLGEVVNKMGQRWDLHLKGAGKTAFSRFGDGRAVLRSSIREYLISEAMFGLGIPTTRALSIVGSDEWVMREGMMEPCAAVLRVSECHIRFGHFEYLYYSRQHELLQQLADYSLQRFYPQLQTERKPYLAFYQEVIKRSAELVAFWQGYGFVHGVLNTDNMSILGETFDYGPYTFMDHYKESYVSNQNDFQARYAFANQPDIVRWNLACLGQALLPLIDREDILATLDQYDEIYQTARLELFRARLGLSQQQQTDRELIDQLLLLFDRQSVDMNRFFRQLSSFNSSGAGTEELEMLFQNPQSLQQWLHSYSARLQLEHRGKAERVKEMDKVNPKFILRNYMAQEVIKQVSEGSFTLLDDLISILRQPTSHFPEYKRFTDAAPNWAGSICLTCSS